jgi:hypothetical protein
VPPLAIPFETRIDPTHLVACIIPEAQAAMATHNA